MERQPVGAYYATISGDLADENGLINDSLMITKGKDLLGAPNYGYHSSAVIRESGIFTYFTGEPGTRVPHLWLDDAHERSTIDWIQGSFTLIAEDIASWQTEIEVVKRQIGINIKLVTSQRIAAKWKEVTGTTKEEALLVRPDDFVATKLKPGSLVNILRSVLDLNLH